jgi:hypothetical protein
LSRNTITKHLNAGTIEPQFTTPDRQSKLDDGYAARDEHLGVVCPTGTWA